MHTPKKLKWNSLCEFRDYLVRETTEKIVLFNGYKLVTETTEYGMVDSLLKINPKQKRVEEPKLELGNRPKVSKKKAKVAEVKSKSKKDILAEMRERGKKALDKKNVRKR
jgi:hypothetical protein